MRRAGATVPLELVATQRTENLHFEDRNQFVAAVRDKIDAVLSLTPSFPSDRYLSLCARPIKGNRRGAWIAFDLGRQQVRPAVLTVKGKQVAYEIRHLMEGTKDRSFVCAVDGR